MRLGADPEVFLLNKNNQLVSCVGLVKGTKWEPSPIPGMPKGFTVQQDNVALEFGIPPACTAKQYADYIQQVLLSSRNLVKGLSYSRSSCEIFPESEMQTAEAHIFGCEPDFNAWTGKENPSPKPPHPFMRSAGGHIHVETRLDKIAVIRAMDLFNGLTSVLRDKNGQARRALYGKPGAFRPKPYGVEYRTLSNYWIFSRTEIERQWKLAEKALSWVSKHGCLADERVPQAIETGDQALAEQLMSEYGVK